MNPKIYYNWQTHLVPSFYPTITAPSPNLELSNSSGVRLNKGNEFSLEGASAEGHRPGTGFGISIDGHGSQSRAPAD